MLTGIHEEGPMSLMLSKDCLSSGFRSVSQFTLKRTPFRLKSAGVSEVKFNLETATDHLFSVMCPGLSRVRHCRPCDAVPLFGRNHVFSNIILGLGESDEEMAGCIENLCQNGIIPVIRPLTPGDLADFQPPEPSRI